MNTNIKAVFFDIGGTLVEKTRNIERDPELIKEMIDLLGLSCSVNQFLEMVYRGEKKYKETRNQTLNEIPIIEKWVQFFLADVDESIVRSHAEILQALWGLSKSRKKVKNYVPIFLTELMERGYILGTISHSTPRHLDVPELKNMFKIMLHAPEFGKRKPHPSLFVNAAHECGLHPNECAYVGDHPWRDVVGPREAGYALVILLQNSATEINLSDEMMQPDIIISDLRQLLDYLPIRVGKDNEKECNGEYDILYDAALSTMWWNKDTQTADDFFKAGRRLGFARFELNHQIPPEVFKSLDLDRFSIGSLHDPCPAYIPAKELERTDVQITSLDESLRHRGVDVVKGTIDQAIRMHARHVVVHPGRIAGDHSLDNQLRDLYRAGLRDSEDYQALLHQVEADRALRAAPHLERLRVSLQEIAAFADGSGLSIGLENRFHYYELPDYDEMNALLDDFKQPWLGWHLDIGHLQVLSQLGLFDYYRWLDSFAKRIVGVHFHDVIGIIDHQPPGSGEVDFVRLAGYLPRDAYRTIEVDKTASSDSLARAIEFLEFSGCVEKII